MAIAIPIADQEITVSLFGEPVANQLNGIIPTAWTALPLMNGWVPFGGSYKVPSYRKIGDLVYLSGVMKGGTAPPSPGQIQVGTMPTGFRPPNALINLVVFGGPDAWGGAGRLDVWATGEVLVIASSAFVGATTIVAFNFAYSIV